MNTSPPQVVAIFNSNDDLVEMIRSLLEHSGFVTVSAHVDEIRRGKLDLVNFVRQHNPAVIVYDLVPPYDRSWNYLTTLMESETLRGRQFVLTSVNATQASEVVGRSQTVYEVVGKPVDLDELVRAVREASRARVLPRGKAPA